MRSILDVSIKRPFGKTYRFWAKIILLKARIVVRVYDCDMKRKVLLVVGMLAFHMKDGKSRDMKTKLP